MCEDNYFIKKTKKKQHFCILHSHLSQLIIYNLFFL